MRFAAAILLAAVLTLPACGRDDVPDPASGLPRIVALSPAVAVTLRDLGLDDLLVGRHGWDGFSDPGLPACGDQAGVDYEVLLSVRPTHVLIQWGQREIPPRLKSLAERHGWEVVSYNPLTLEQTRDMAEDLWRRFGEGGAGAPRPGVLDEMAELWGEDGEGAGAGGVGSSLRVLLLHGVSPPHALGPGSFHHQILERIGARPAIAAGSPYITLDAEDVLHLKPDAIILLSPRPPRSGDGGGWGVVAAENQAQVLGALARLDVPAVRAGRVGVIDDPECLLPTSSLSRVTRQIREMLAQWEGEAE